MTLCFCWCVTVSRLSKRLRWLNNRITNDFPKSPHAFWLRAAEPASTDDQEGVLKTRGTSPTTAVLTWIMPVLFMVAYAALWFSS